MDIVFRNLFRVDTGMLHLLNNACLTFALRSIDQVMHELLNEKAPMPGAFY